jgi:hypothetical protein
MKNTYIAFLVLVIALGFGYFKYFRPIPTDSPVVVNPSPSGEVGGTAQNTNTSVATLAVSGSVNAAGVVLSNEKTITWRTTGYPTDAGVNINILKKTSSNPSSYTLVRTLAKDTANDGTEKWTPKSNETGNDIYVEVTCSTTYAFSGGCTLSSEPMKAN